MPALPRVHFKLSTENMVQFQLGQISSTGPQPPMIEKFKPLIEISFEIWEQKWGIHHPPCTSILKAKTLSFTYLFICHRNYMRIWETGWKLLWRWTKFQKKYANSTKDLESGTLSLIHGIIKPFFKYFSLSFLFNKRIVLFIPDLQAYPFHYQI